MPGSQRPTIAIVDDEPQLRELYSTALSAKYRIREAGSGEAALDLLDDEVDVLLLDRRMPGLAGEDVLERVREQGYDIPVAMLTGVVPDFDVLEMGFDDYVLKPVGLDDLEEVIETLLRRQEYDEAVREYFALASKLAALRSSKQPDGLESDERLARLEEQLEAMQRRATRSLDTAMDAGAFEDLVSEPVSTRRMFEDVDDEDDSASRYD